MKVTDRLQEYLKLREISPYTFERTCSIANGYLKKQMKGKGSIGSKIVERITEKYKDLNVSWLLTGKGQMLVSNYSLSDEISAIAEKELEYAKHEQIVSTLREKILILENALADKEKIIKLLEKQHAEAR
jgi:hypothetical protein